MRTKSIIKKMKTVCGKELSYLETTGEPNKMHSTEGPAITYAAEEKKAPEYYLFGIKYSKLEWKSLLSQNKPMPIDNAMGFNSLY
jgi:hypothetical protein